MSTSKQTNKEVPTQPQPWLISGKSTLSKTQLQLTTTRSGRLNMTSSGGKEGTPFSKQAPMASLSSTQPSQGYALRPMASFSATQPQKGNALYSSTPLNFNQQGQQQQQGYALRPSPSLSYTPQQQQQQQQQQMYALRSTASLNYIQPMQGYGQQQQQQQQQFSLYSSQSRGAFKCQAPQWFVMPQQKYVSPLPCSEDSDSSSSDEEAEGRNILPNLDEMEKIYGDSYKKHKLSTSLKNMGITDYRKISNLCKSFIVEKEASGKLNKYETNIEDGMGIAVYTYEDEEVSNGAVCPFRVINTCLSKTRTLEALNKIKDTFFNIVTGLRKLPRFYPSSKTLYRGIRERVDLEMYTKGKTVTWSAFSSASTDMSVIKNFLSSSGDAYGTMFIIQGDPWGYDITDFSFFEDERGIQILFFSFLFFFFYCFIFDIIRNSFGTRQAF